jgi:hypothetical protein
MNDTILNDDLLEIVLTWKSEGLVLTPICHKHTWILFRHFQNNVKDYYEILWFCGSVVAGGMDSIWLYLLLHLEIYNLSVTSPSVLEWGNLPHIGKESQPIRLPAFCACYFLKNLVYFQVYIITQ